MTTAMNDVGGFLFRALGSTTIAAALVTSAAREATDPPAPRAKHASPTPRTPVGRELPGGPTIVEFGGTFRSELVDVVARRRVLGIEVDGIARVDPDGRVVQRHLPCDTCAIAYAAPHGAGDGVDLAGASSLVRYDGRAFAAVPLELPRRAHRGAGYTPLQSLDATPRDEVLGIDGASGIFVLDERGRIRNEAPSLGDLRVLATGGDVAWFGAASAAASPAALVLRTSAGIVRDVAADFVGTHDVGGLAVTRDGSLVAVATPRSSAGAAAVVRIARDGTTRVVHALAASGASIASAAIDGDDDVWYALEATATVHRLRPDGRDDAFPLPLPAGAVIGRMTFAADGSLWLVGAGANVLAQRTPDGRVRVIGSGLRPTNEPSAPVVTRDGAVWFQETLSWHRRIARVGPDGRFTEYPDAGYVVLRADGDDVDEVAVEPPGTDRIFPTVVLSADGRTRTSTLRGCVQTLVSVVCGPPSLRFAQGRYRPSGAALGADGAMWFTDTENSLVGRIARDGSVRAFVRGLTRWHSGPQYLTRGPDGALWFTEQRDRVGRVATDGTIREFGGLPARSFPGGIVAGRDGNLWFTLYHGNELVRMTPRGTMTRFRRGIFPSRGNDDTADAVPVRAPDDRLWFNEPQAGRLAIATLPKQ